ncbi:MAG: dihydrolipoyl dehydrogenase, partial [Methylococcales bacterium]|nr:dihydrolipoyl dehydrogenase [Methylococcales bacterium]
MGQEVSEGDAIIELTLSEAAAAKPVSDTQTSQEPATPAAQPADKIDQADHQYDTDLLVIGSGPGGYTAAFRAADLGLNVTLIERYSTIGGVCLNVGCIPSKALLHAAKVIEESKDAEDFGLTFNAPEIDLQKLLNWKSGVVSGLTGGLAQLAKQRKVKIVNGFAKFTSDHAVSVESDGKHDTISFKNAVIAAGSRAVKIPGFPYDDPRLIDSTGALALSDIPETMLVIGGGIIGLEMATVYHALGTKICVVEMMDALIPGADKDLVRPLQRRIQKQYENIWLKTKVTGIEAQDDGLKVSFEGAKAPETALFDRVLVAIGRTPNGATIDADKAGVKVSERGFIEVDALQKTNVPHIFAIGDLVGQP